ncbi:MAG: carboxylating nicotinate-nucleotide diphosphorylase [Elusimicrobiota bacterium]|jgi:nicotinate-nucleotide pyrophosphorylase (carboxylating)|nr:carboxylating nicotinate-nucleotide diphosphorylase [Elusimicrobiota bacterium]
MNVSTLIKTALKEDGAFNDITSKSFIGQDKKAKAVLLAKKDGILCGTALFTAVFKALDKNCIVKFYKKDGDCVQKGVQVAKLRGNAQAVLSAERTALNFIGHLSGISTLTNHFVKLIAKGKPKIFDTRKTIPAYRALAKYAVVCGGGKNHRIGLSDMALIKDNHLKLISNLNEALALFRKKHKNILAEIECENQKEVQAALNAGADIIMLDNMQISRAKKAIKLIRDFSSKNYKPEIEISGGVNLDTIKKFAKLDIERISVGMLTHSAQALDLSLEITIE